MSCIQLAWKKICPDKLQFTKSKLDTLIQKYGYEFQDKLGTMKHSKPTCMLSRFHHPWRVLFSIRRDISWELDRLEREGIIDKVEWNNWAMQVRSTST